MPTHDSMPARRAWRALALRLLPRRVLASPRPARRALALLLLALGACGESVTDPAGVTATFSTISAGGAHTCALTPAGRVYCWGSNTAGQLGAADTAAVRPVPVPVAGRVLFLQLSAGGAHTCALATEGRAYCWGDGSNGQLGTGARTSTRAPAAVEGARLQSISAGGLHTCGLDGDGVAYCWGNNAYGQLGTGDDLPRDGPTRVLGAPAFVTLDAASWHTCGLTADGRVYCWGYHLLEQIGENALGRRCGFAPCEPTPVLVGGLPRVRTVDAGGLQSCAMDDAGGARCWGADLAGELGAGIDPGESSARPLRVAGEHSFAELSVGEHATCAVEGPRAYCWGSNGWGQLGIGEQGGQHFAPVEVLGGTLVRVSAGMQHACGLDARGVAYCWGDNREGQIGDGTTATRIAPERVRAARD
ncbi:MAG: hypothetical protein HY561_02025 [Gemmatimonadetes bacterium]|nr:hypothetical protein [Gemmatimonadota bacterium]